jgi:hypothetical protein
LFGKRERRENDHLEGGDWLRAFFSSDKNKMRKEVKEKRGREKRKSLI